MKSRQSSVLFSLPSICLGALVFWFVSPAQSQESSPTQGLKSAYRLLNSQQFELAQTRFDHILSSSPQNSWALVGKAVALSHLGQSAGARDTLEGVKQGDAASLDTEVFRYYSAPAEFREEARADLKIRLKAAGREELLTAYLEAQTKNLIEQSSPLAMESYRELRPRYFLRHSILLGPKLLGPKSVFSLFQANVREEDRRRLNIFEIEQLLAEKKIDEAARLLSQIPPELLLDREGVQLRARLARAKGQSDESERILSSFLESKTLDGREAVMLELIRTSWNANSFETSRSFANRFLSEFRHSPSAGEVELIRAKTWLDQKKWKEGTADLLHLAQSPTPSDHSCLAERELAWLYFRQGDLPRAIEWFQKYAKSGELRLRSLSSESNPVERNKKRRDATFEYDHARFWIAELCEKLPPKTRKGTCSRKAEEHWKAILSDSPLGYYSLLSAKRLKKPFPPPELLSLVKKSSVVPSPNCLAQLSASSRASLEQLKQEELGGLVKIEVNWSLLNSRPNTADPICKIMLLQYFGDISSGLKLAEDTLRTRDIRQETESLATLLQADFPIAFADDFRQASRNFNVPLPLILSIARTESYFDPSARSTSDARGLLQLLPKTAKMEGLQDADLLFDAETNIPTGTQHLRRLLNTFQGNEDFVAGAYNGGQEAVRRWQERNSSPLGSRKTDLNRLGIDAWIETVPYGETRNYFKKVRLAKAWYSALLSE